MVIDIEAERQSVDHQLREICDTYLLRSSSASAHAAGYALTGPGKRLRPLLLKLAYRACKGVGDATYLSCAPEVIHTYSLVHDDLPCMDDDDMRRGRPTVHKVYDSRTAVTAGLTLIPLSVIVVRDGAREIGADNATSARMTQVLLQAAGAGGMIGGQVRDLSGEGLALTLNQREEIHAAKTAALIAASLMMGAIAAAAPTSYVDAFQQFGQAIGLAFQVMDDVLDVTATSGVMGKTTGRDVALRKSTFPSLLGVDGARERAERLIAEGSEALAEHGLLTRELSQVANFMVTRKS